MTRIRISLGSTLASLILCLTALPSGWIANANAAEDYLSPSAPINLTIPTLKVATSIIKLGLDDKGALQVPKTENIAGWYIGSPTPGEIGPTIIVAHVDMNGKFGVFYNLKKMKPGDVIRVARADKKVVTYKVTSTSIFQKAKFPTQKIYGNIDHAGLRLITCGGKFNKKIGHYDSNVVVFAEAI